MSLDQIPSSTDPYLYTYSYNVNTNRAQSPWIAQTFGGNIEWMDEFVDMK